MQQRTPSIDPADDEVAFWRGFIVWWAGEEQEPVPARAWEALANAEMKDSNRVLGTETPGNSKETERLEPTTFRTRSRH
jgi:hypothetical protein